MPDVSYKYDMDQKVITPFGEDGIVTWLGFDEGGKQYHVKTAQNETWYKEKELEAR